MPEVIECESGSYPVVDAYGNPIEVGSPVKYGGTGTKGHVTEIICDDEGAWAIIDTNDLLYKLESLSLLEGLEAKAEIGVKEFTMDEMQEMLEKDAEARKAEKLDDTNLEAGG
jgi:hypothetical protein